MSRKDRIPNLEPELVPEQRIKLSLDYQDRKHSVFLPVWLLVLILAFLLCIAVLLGIFAFRGGDPQDPKRLRELQTENKYLSGRLAGFEAELDSLETILDTLGLAPAEERDFPYYSGKTEEAKLKLRNTPSLVGALGSVEQKLTNLWSRMGLSVSSAVSDPGTGSVSTGDGIPSIYPTFGSFTDDYGMRIHPISDSLSFHQGVDIANEIGTPVYATADGVVKRVEYEDGFGKLISITHANGYETLYGHLHGFRVKPGELVHKGQIIALMGNTGSSTGPHLHYRVMRSGEALNPANFLNRLDTPLYTTR